MQMQGWQIDADAGMLLNQPPAAPVHPRTHPYGHHPQPYRAPAAAHDMHFSFFLYLYYTYIFLY
jgi:hypothetical protein